MENSTKSDTGEEGAASSAAVSSENAATSSTNSGSASPAHNVSSAPPAQNGSRYRAGEEVLATLNGRIHKAEVERVERRGAEWRYYIHFCGWSRSLDEWVGVERLMKCNKENVQNMKEPGDKCKVDKGVKVTNDGTSTPENVSLGDIQGKRRMHKWTRQADEIMLQSLLEMSLDKNWKPKGNFRGGFLVEVERRMREKWPKCTATAHPHIENRHRYLKQKYFAITELLRQPGCTWDDEQKMIKCDWKWYMNWVKSHPHAGSLYNVPFPHFRTVGLIYSKDRASLRDVETVIKTTINMEEVAPNDEQGGEGQDIGEGDSAAHSFSVNVETPTGSKRKSGRPRAERASKKGKPCPSEEELVLKSYDNLMVQLCTLASDISSHMSTIATAMAREQSRLDDRERKCSKVVQDLMSIDGLSCDDVLDVAPILVRNPEHLTVYYQLPNSMKRQFVTRLLRPSE